VFGLFVGASFVSLFEIAEILIEMAFILFCWIKNRKAVILDTIKINI
jgi:hypothetical protein